MLHQLPSESGAACRVVGRPFRLHSPDCPGLLAPWAHRRSAQTLYPLQHRSWLSSSGPATAQSARFSQAFSHVTAGAREPAPVSDQKPQNKPCGQKVTSTKSTLLGGRCLCLSFTVSLGRWCWVMKRMYTLDQGNDANPASTLDSNLNLNKPCHLFNHSNDNSGN